MNLKLRMGQFFCKLGLLVSLLPLSALSAENTGSVEGGEVRLYLMPAYPVRMGWDSPKQLTANSIKAIISNRSHSIGHVAVEINCPNLGGRDSHVITGATPVTAKDNFNLLFKDFVGLGILEVSWPGKLESEADVVKALDYRRKSKEKLAAMTFMVNDASCKRMLDYLREYSEVKPMWYGNSPQPRRKEGSGCSAFGVSFLEIAGVMTKEFRDRWIVARRVPLATMGGYIYPKVTVGRLLSMEEAKRWANPDEPHMALETFEPQYMYDWVRELAENPDMLKALGGEIDESLKKTMPLTPAIRIDRRNVTTLTSEPIFRPGPFLKNVNAYGVIRSDKVQAPNGSFELKP